MAATTSKLAIPAGGVQDAALGVQVPSAPIIRHPRSGTGAYERDVCVLRAPRMPDVESVFCEKGLSIWGRGTQFRRSTAQGRHGFIRPCLGEADQRRSAATRSKRSATVDFSSE